MGSIESSEFFTRWRPVIVIVKFHDLSRLEEARHNGGLLNHCRERSAPTLHRYEEQAIFTYTNPEDPSAEHGIQRNGNGNSFPS